MTTTVLQGKTATLLATIFGEPGGALVDLDATPTIEMVSASDASTVLAATTTGVVSPATGLYRYTWVVPADQTPGPYLATWEGTAGGDSVILTEVVTVAAVPTYDAVLGGARRYDRVPYQATNAVGAPIPGAHGTVWDATSDGNQVTNLTQLDGVTPIPGGILVADSRGYFPAFLDWDRTPNLFIIGSETGEITGVDRVLIEPSDTDDRVIAIETYLTGSGGLGDRLDAIDADRGEPGGLATLGADGRVLPSQLPLALASQVLISVADYGAAGDGVSDDAPSIQAALNAIAVNTPGATLAIPAGTYLVNSELEIKSAVTIDIARGATVRRGSASMQYVFRNFNSSYAPTLYGGRGGIRITGNGVIDAAGDTLTGSVTAIIFAHTKDARVDGITIRNIRDWHCIEFNSTQDGLAEACVFEGFNAVASGRSISEAVQIDLAKDSGVLPGIGSGAYDDTPCDNILVTGCTVRGYGSLGSFGRLTGSHSYTDSVFHKKIRVTDNHAETLNDYMVRGYNWQDVVVQGNTCVDSNGGVRFEAPSGATVGGEAIAVAGNTFRNMGLQNNGTAVLPAVISIAGLTTPSSVPVREMILSTNVIKTFANAAAVEVINTADGIAADNVIKNGTATGCKGIDWVSSANGVIDNNKIDTVAIGVHTREVNSVSGAGTSVGGTFAACSTTGVQMDAPATSLVRARIRASGNASKASAEVNASQCMVDCAYIWKSSGAGNFALKITSSATDTQVALLYGRGWGTNQSDNISDSGTTSTISSTGKYISTA